MSNLDTLKQQLTKLNEFDKYRNQRIGQMIFEDSKQLAKLLQDCWEWISDDFDMTDKVKNYYAVPMPQAEFVHLIIGNLTEEEMSYNEFKKAATHALRMNALAKEIAGSWPSIVQELGMTTEEIDNGGCSFDLGARTMMRHIKYNPEQLEKLFASFDKLSDVKRDECRALMMFEATC